MPDNNKKETAVEGLQQLGLKKYEAEVLVGLSRIGVGTAKDISELTDVPRTRVYDSIRVLETKGLVEVQHANPKKFRAVSLGEATATLRKRYDEQIERVENALKEMEEIKPKNSPVQEVWSLSGPNSVENRADQLIDEAESEVVLVVGHESALSEKLLDSLRELNEGVNLFVGILSDSIRERVEAEVPRAKTFASGLEWMHAEVAVEKRVDIGRLLLVDRSTILVSCVKPDSLEEYAVFGEGFENGFVVIARRVMAEGLASERDTE
jgi:sugar-specific transcriptional regulator TrmB